MWRGIGLVAISVAIACGGGSGDNERSWQFMMEGRSMEPTLESGQFVTIVELTGRAERGDLVLFKPPPPAPQERRFLKRVVGLPDETIEMRAGDVYIDGEVIEEPYILEPAAYTLELQTVPTDAYFVLGDNRDNSSDSHTWGALPAQNVVGRVDKVMARPTTPVR